MILPKDKASTTLPATAGDFFFDKRNSITSTTFFVTVGDEP
jgi:hypothetical protein